MKRICIYCQLWESGGIESFLSNALQQMDLSGLQVDIIVDVLKESVFTQPLRRRGVRFFELSGNPRRLFRNHRMFTALLCAERYDVVHLNIFHGVSLYYAYLAKRAGVLVRIAHSHNTGLRKSVTKPAKCFLHWSAKELLTQSATGLWACSAPAAEFLFSKGQMEKRPFRFTPNGIDVAKFRFRADARERTREELGLRGQFVIGSVGRLCQQKNQRFLLNIFAEIVRKRPDSCLLLVGEGEDKAALRQRAERLEIAERVTFYGVSDRVEALLWAMDVFVFPSLFEGLGIAGIEAQAAGLPVVCSNRIPAEARVLERIHVMPLEAGIEAWADGPPVLCRPSGEQGNCCGALYGNAAGSGRICGVCGRRRLCGAGDVRTNVRGSPRDAGRPGHMRVLGARGREKRHAQYSATARPYRWAESAHGSILALCGPLPFLWNKLYSRRLAGLIKEPLPMKIGEDMAVCMALAPYVQRAVLLPEAFYHYVIYDVSSIHRRRRLDGEINPLDQFLRHIATDPAYDVPGDSWKYILAAQSFISTFYANYSYGQDGFTGFYRLIWKNSPLCGVL